MKPRVAYIMSRFPHLPETFILREMTEMSRQGWPVALYPLILQRQPVVHREALPWMERMTYVPFMSADVVGANLRAMVRRPGPFAGVWGRTVWDNVRCPGFLARALMLFPKTMRMAELMKGEGVAHIHAHYATHPALVAWAIHRMTGISYSFTVHAHDIFEQTAMLAAKIKDAAFVVAISNFNKEYLRRVVGGWVAPKTHVIHCGIEPSEYVPRSAPGSTGERFEILSIGSLQPYKGHTYLVETCELLREKGIDFRCRIVGEGAERPLLEGLIADHGLQERVFLLGAMPQHEVARLLPTADCYVQPSVVTATGKMEGIPVALMEALACSLPVVATDISGIPELVRPGKTGFLVPPRDAVSLCEALVHVHQSRQEAAQLAAAGRRLVLEEFDLTRNVTSLGRLFEQTMLGSHVPSAGPAPWAEGAGPELAA